MQVFVPYRRILQILTAFFLLCFFVRIVRGQGASEGQSATFEALAKSAATARDSGRTSDAIRDFQQALRIRPEWSEGWWYLGTLLYDGDQYSDAIQAFQKLLQLVPGSGPAWSFLGLCEFETKDYANSLEHLRKGLNLGDGDDPEVAPVAKYHLALLLIRTGAFEEATNSLSAAFGQSQIPAQVQLALGLALLRVPLLPSQIDPAHDALVHAAGETAAALARNDTPTAIERLSSLIKDYPGVPYIHYAYALALSSAGQQQDALRQFQEETRISPDSTLVHVEMSRLLLRMNRPQEAVGSAEEAVKFAPDSPASHLALGQALRASGKNERAAQELATAGKLAPEKPQLEKRILQWYAQQNILNKPRTAQASATQVNNSDAGSFEEFSDEAREAQQKGNTETAIENYEKALQLRPEWDDGRWNLAMLLFSAARYTEAIGALKSFVERKPRFGTAWAVMGLSEFETHDYKNALIHLERGEELGFGGSPESVRIARVRLAVLLDQDGQFERAMQALAPETASSPLANQVQFALGMALLRIRLLPEQVEPAKTTLVETAGEVAALLQNSKYNLAFPKFELLLKNFPATPFLHYAYGTALLSLSKYDEAEMQMREELKISPQSELPYLRLASLALKRRQPAEALPLAKRAAQIAPDSAEAHYLWGRAGLDLGQEDVAIRELETAGKLSPNSPEVHFNLGKAYARAKLPEKAEQERAIFTRLNDLAEQQRSHSGNQAYGAHNALEPAPTRSDGSNPAPQRP